MADAPKRLSEIAVHREGRAVILELVDGAGARLRFLVEDEQLDVLADHIDDLLGTGADD